MKLFLPFFLGCAASLVVGHAIVDVRAQGASQGSAVHVCVDSGDVMRVVALTATCPNGQRSLVLGSAFSGSGAGQPQNKTPDKTSDPSLDQAKLKELNLRLMKLEQMGCSALRRNKVVAPFYVVDRSGQPIFSVIENAMGLFQGSGPPVAAVVADQDGLFSAKGGDMRVSLGIVNPTVVGVNVSEGGKSKANIGKGEKGNYRLVFLSSSGQQLSAIGENALNQGGLLLINDAGGIQRVVMQANDDGTGRVGIMAGSGKPIAALAEGEGGAGVFYACAAGGNCDPVMVGAGTNAQGVGVVATGPRFYTGGPTGAPGSFLVGKQ